MRRGPAATAIRGAPRTQARGGSRAVGYRTRARSKVFITPSNASRIVCPVVRPAKDDDCRAWASPKTTNQISHAADGTTTAIQRLRRARTCGVYEACSDHREPAARTDQRKGEPARDDPVAGTVVAHQGPRAHDATEHGQVVVEEHGREAQAREPQHVARNERGDERADRSAQDEVERDRDRHETHDAGDSQRRVGVEAEDRERHAVDRDDADAQVLVVRLEEVAERRPTRARGASRRPRTRARRTAESTRRTLRLRRPRTRSRTVTVAVATDRSGWFVSSQAWAQLETVVGSPPADRPAGPPERRYESWMCSRRRRTRLSGVGVTLQRGTARSPCALPGPRLGEIGSLPARVSPGSVAEVREVAAGRRSRARCIDAIAVLQIVALLAA